MARIDCDERVMMASLASLTSNRFLIPLEASLVTGDAINFVTVIPHSAQE